MKLLKSIAAPLAAFVITIFAITWLFVTAGLHLPPTIEPPRQGSMETFILNDPPRDAPGMTFRGDDGKIFRLADFKGRVVLVNFWATWCAPCIRELPTLNRLEKTLGDEDFAVIAVNVDRDGANVARPFLDKNDVFALPLYFDDKMALAREFGLKQMPTSYLLDREGKVAGSLTGFAEWDSPEADALIRHYLRQGQ